MRLKYSLLLILLFVRHFSAAQAVPLQKQVDRIDSLMYNNVKDGEKELDRLYDSLIRNDVTHKNRETELRLQLIKASIYSDHSKISKSLELSLDIIDQAKEHRLPGIEYEACLVAALVYELSKEFDLCKVYLDKAYTLYKRNGLESVYSHYCIRVSSYYRFAAKKDSALYFASKGFEYAHLYQNRRDYLDACLLLGILLPQDDFDGAIKYTSFAAAGFLDKHDYYRAAIMYNNIARKSLIRKDIDKAHLYNDSAFWVYREHSLPDDEYSLRVRSQIFESLGKTDSAFHYFRRYHDAYVLVLNKRESVEIKKVTDQYESDKKQAIIKNKDLQLEFIIILLTVIAGASALLIRKNRKINAQNKVISKQVEELMKTLEQKQVLLSELQHRVKNNLQHVISILEMQKESVDFNNIDELIRGNQNRIHSMALLHKKLNVSENVNEVDLKKYIVELSELVKDSYSTQRKKISLNVICDIEKMSIEKALPVGLIIVELVSNSMKHAFGKQNEGVIHIALTCYEEETAKTRLYYADNGSGFDFNKTSETGLGMEIIKGLIGQLDATVESHYNKGFELTLRF